MKKSEMIEIIAEVLETTKLEPSNQVKAITILDKMEEHEMLPPITVVKMGDTVYTDNCWDKEE